MNNLCDKIKAMKNVRWYDRNPDLKEVFEFIQELDSSIQKEIGKDIIQMLMNDFNLDLDDEINRISKNYNYDCKRWYDDNIDLFTSFEIIKKMPSVQKVQVIQKIVMTVLLIYLEEEVTGGGVG